MLKTRPNTRNGADNCMPILKAAAKARVASAATSPLGISSPGEKIVVAVVQRRDDQMMAVGRKQQVTPSMVRKFPISTPCWPWVGSTEVTKSEAELLGDHRAGDLQRRKRHPRGGAEHDADDDLVEHQHQQRRQRAHVDLVGRRGATAG